MYSAFSCVSFIPLVICCFSKEILAFASTKDSLDVLSVGAHYASFEDTTWAVIDPETFLPCIKLQGAISFQVSPGEHVGTDLIQIPPETVVAVGQCNSLWGDYQDIKLIWNSTNIDKDDAVANMTWFSIYFGFATDWESDYSELKINSDEFALNSVTVTYEVRSNHSYPISYSVSDLNEFLTPKNKSFVCSKVQLREGDLTINISNLRFQAFSLHEDDFLSSYILCDADFSQEKNAWFYIGEGLKWFFLGFFSFCLLGLVLVLFVGVCSKRHDIVAIGYRIIGNNSHS